MTRRRRRHQLDFSDVVRPLPKTYSGNFVLSANDGSNADIDVRGVPGMEGTPVRAALLRAVQLAGEAKGCGNRNSLYKHRHYLHSSFEALVRACEAFQVTDPAEIKTIHVDSIQRALHTYGYAPDTVETSMRSICSLLRWLPERNADLQDRLGRAYSLTATPGFSPPGEESPREPYSRKETSTIIRFCDQQLRTSLARVREGKRRLMSLQSATSLSPSERLLLSGGTIGPMSNAALKSAGLTVKGREGSPNSIYRSIFPVGQDLQFACWLFCAATGIEASSAQCIRISELKGGIALYLKLRGCKPGEVRAISPTAQRLIDAILELTSVARALLTHSLNDFLWISLDSSTRTIRRDFFHSDRARRCNELHGLLDDRGNCLQISSARLRTTYINLSRKDGAPDRSHSARVDLEHYTLTEANGEVLASVVESGLEAGLRAAISNGGPLRTTNAEEDVAQSAEPSDPGLDSLVAGCRDPSESPLRSDGGFCAPPDAWICFRCANCVVEPRHLPKSLATKRWLEEQCDLMPYGEWMVQWYPTYREITEKILPKFRPEQIGEATIQAEHLDATVWMPMRAVMYSFLGEQP